jgi:hypothetical protein
VTRTPSEGCSPSRSEVTAPVHSPDAEGAGTNAVVIVVPIVVVLVVVGIVTVALWCWRRHRQRYGAQYKGMDDAFLPVRADSLSDYGAGA